MSGCQNRNSVQFLSESPIQALRLAKVLATLMALSGSLSLRPVMAQSSVKGFGVYYVLVVALAFIMVLVVVFALIIALVVALALIMALT